MYCIVITLATNNYMIFIVRDVHNALTNILALLLHRQWYHTSAELQDSLVVTSLSMKKMIKKKNLP